MAVIRVASTTESVLGRSARGCPRVGSVRRCRGSQCPTSQSVRCLVLADISGYTSYLAGVELDYAQDILADLTDAVIRALRPTFRLAKLEGDAAFATSSPTS